MPEASRPPRIHKQRTSSLQLFSDRFTLDWLRSSVKISIFQNKHIYVTNTFFGSDVKPLFSPDGFKLGFFVELNDWNTFNT